MKFLDLFFVLSLIRVGLGASYYLSENIVGNGFYRSFDWQAIKDPTHGRV